jgi:hypothetical protein
MSLAIDNRLDERDLLFRELSPACESAPWPIYDSPSRRRRPATHFVFREHEPGQLTPKPLKNQHQTTRRKFPKKYPDKKLDKQAQKRYHARSLIN